MTRGSMVYQLSSMTRTITVETSSIQLIVILTIVAIHGISAPPDETWRKYVDAHTPEERYLNRISDHQMLPAVVPLARIVRYGYQSQWFGEEMIGLKASTVA